MVFLKNIYLFEENQPWLENSTWGKKGQGISHLVSKDINQVQAVFEFSMVIGFVNMFAAFSEV